MLHALLRKFEPVILLGVPLVVIGLVINASGNETYISRATLALCYVVIAVGFFIFSGNSGVLSFGHFAFVMLAAYTSALLTIAPAKKKGLFPEMPGFLQWIWDTHLSPFPAMVAGMAVAVVVAAIVGIAIVRLGGAQAAIATVALLVIVQVVVKETDSVTRGVSTMVGVPHYTTLVSALFYAIIAIAVAAFYQDSKRGLRLRASREDPRAAAAVGVRISTERWIAWVISAAVAAAGGTLYGHFISTFSTINFEFRLTFLTIAMLVIGGLRSLSGAVIGVVFVSVLTELLRQVEVNGFGPVPKGRFPGLTEVILSLLLILVLIVRPNGITGGRELRFPRFGRRDQPPVTGEPGTAEV